MKSKSILVVMVLVVTIGSLSAQANVIKLVSLEWPPYIGSSLTTTGMTGTNQGFVAAIVTEAFRKAGYTLVIEFKPWNRALDEATRGVYDGLFPEYYSDERKVDFLYSEEIMGGPVGYLKRKADTFTIRQSSDLANLRIGIVAGYIHLQEIETTKGLRTEEVSDDETGIRMLLGNRLDVMEMDKYVAQYIIRDKFASRSAELEFIEPAREILPLYIVFSKKAANYQQKAAAFNRAIAQMKTDGSITRILAQYGF
jgi:polar amino acid transport system substrate-binding protein